MIKYLLISLLFVNSVFSYKFNIIKNYSSINNNLINRRKLFSLSPLVITFLGYNNKDNDNDNDNDNKSIQELRQEANRIIEIIEAQKKSFDLPSIKENDDIINNINKNEKKTELVNYDIENILNIILYTFKKKTPDEAITKLKSYASDMNTIKRTSNERLISLFNNTKYGIFFNKFKYFQIINYEKYNEESNEFYNVDVKIYAKYKDLLYNSFQFNDIYYPENTDLNNNENICYIIFKWNFIKKNNKYELVSCYLVPRT